MAMRTSAFSRAQMDVFIGTTQLPTKDMLSLADLFCPTSSPKVPLVQSTPLLGPPSSQEDLPIKLLETQWTSEAP